MARKDVENQHRAIDDRHGNHLFEVLALARAQIVEHEHELGAMLFDQLGDLARLAAADERRRIDVLALLHDARDDLRAGRFASASSSTSSGSSGRCGSLVSTATTIVR